MAKVTTRAPIVQLSQPYTVTGHTRVFCSLINGVKSRWRDFWLCHRVVSNSSDFSKIENKLVLRQRSPYGITRLVHFAPLSTDYEVGEACSFHTDHILYYSVSWLWPLPTAIAAAAFSLHLGSLQHVFITFAKHVMFSVASVHLFVHFFAKTFQAFSWIFVGLWTTVLWLAKPLTFWCWIANCRPFCISVHDISSDECCTSTY